MSFAEKLKTALEYRNWTQAHLARATQIMPSRISQWLNGRSSCKYETAIVIAEALRVNVQWLLEVKDVPMLSDGEIISITEDGKIPVYSCVRAGNGELGITDGKIESYISVDTDYLKQRVFAIRVSGDSMVDDVYEGEIVLFRPMRSDEEIKPTGIYAVEVEGWAEWVIKKIIKDPSGIILLISSNSNYKPREIDPKCNNVKVWGKLIETRRTFR